jgi:2'-5' RNA ligase
MTATSAEGAQPAGRGGLIVPVPAAELKVEPWMERYLPIWKLGVPAHVTLLFPFPTLDQLGASARAELAARFADTPAITVTFDTVGQFPDVVYLAPEPRDWFIRQTEALSSHFGLRPYGGLHAEIVPHLTVARHADPAVQAQIADALRQVVPIVTSVHEVWLVEEEPSGRWQRAAVFPLGPLAP